MIKQGIKSLARTGLPFIFFFCQTAWPFNQPPFNLSVTTFVDGGAPPGVHYLNYFVFVNGDQPIDSDGNVIQGNAKAGVLTHLSQLYVLSNFRIFKARAGLDLVLPLVSPTVRGSFGPVPLSANSAGLGDLVLGSALQWDPGPLFGGPLFHRLEFVFVLPTGKYDSNDMVNPGSNLTTFNPYYSAVWFFRPKWEMSLRFWYAVHDENTRIGIRPGQIFHVNYAFSREVAPKWRLGTAGYFLQQLTEDKINGAESVDSKERAAAVGPGLAYLGNGLAVMLSFPFEFSVRNRFRGTRSTLQMIVTF